MSSTSQRHALIHFGTLCTILYTLFIGYLNYRQYYHLETLQQRKIVSAYPMFNSVCAIEMDLTNEHLYPDCPVQAKTQLFSLQYEQHSLRIGAYVQAFESLIKVIWFGTSLFPSTWQRLSSCCLSPSLGFSSAVASIETFLYFMVIYQLSLLPFHVALKYYKRNYVRPRYYGPSGKGPLWKLLDKMISGCFKTAFNYTMFVTFVVISIQWNNWYFIYFLSSLLKYAAGEASQLGMLASNEAVPVLLSPIGNLLEPMLHLENFKVEDIYLSLENTENALIMGSLGDYIILVYQGLYDKLNTDEFKAIIAHELGHWRLSHGNIYLAFCTVWNFMKWILMCHFITTVNAQDPFGLFPLDKHTKGNIGFEAGFSSFLLLHFTMDWVALPFSILDHWLSQRHEYAADSFAVLEFPFGGSLITALTKIVSRHSMDPLVNLLFATHPTLDQRIENILDTLKNRV